MVTGLVGLVLGLAVEYKFKVAARVVGMVTGKVVDTGTGNDKVVDTGTGNIDNK